MALTRAPKLRQACSRRASVRRSTQHVVVRASSFKAEPSAWKPAADEPAGAALDWVKPDFDLDRFCLQREIRKFSQAAAGALVVDGVVVEEEKAAVPVVDRFSFKLPMYHKPDFATMRPFWHELL